MHNKNSNSSYVVSVGEAGKYRLDLLNNVFAPYSERFLKRAGIKPGMQVLDVGCGTGNMSCKIAELVGTTGQVVGIDISEEQLIIAREQAKQKSLTNISFVQAAAENVLSLNRKFDLVYCRALLIHVEQPFDVLKDMYASLKPGGILACEDGAMSSCFPQPPSPAFDRSIQMLFQYGEKIKVDFDLGDRLYHMYKALGIKDVNINLEQPIVTRNPEKKLIEINLVEAAPKYIAHSIATQAEIDDVLQKIKAWSERDDSYFGCARITQVWAAR
jgi:ubiquinone/menaquinone biosynthesis C-methylase UbiE